MIILITTLEKDKKTGHDHLIVSHGVDFETGKNVILPCEPPQALGAVYDEDLLEFVLHREPTEPKSEKTSGPKF